MGSDFTKSGHVSNHTLGRAVDSRAEGVSIVKVPVVVTERALRNILLMPRQVWPSG